MFRKLEHHVLIKCANGYHLEGHPEVEIRRYQGGQGNRAFHGWDIRFKGLSPSEHGHLIAGDLESVDGYLCRFGACADCGAYSYRAHHPHERCGTCAHRHDDMARGYSAAAKRVADIERAYQLAERMRAAPTLDAAAADMLGLL